MIASVNMKISQEVDNSCCLLHSQEDITDIPQLADSLRLFR